jgi:Reverse transcriptase (RNA-dependent DNA polymerase)
LKQSPRVWFGRFSQAMKDYGYTQSESDHTMFFKKNHNKIAVLIIYVDDIIITGNDHIEIEELEARLSKEFEMKILGGLKYFGIEVSRNNYISRKMFVVSRIINILPLPNISFRPLLNPKP